MKRYLNLSVYDAAVQRLRSLYDNGDTVVVSFSGGKDSTICLELTIEAARQAGKLPVHCVMRDEEIMFPGTFEYCERVAQRKDEIDFHWLIANQPIVNIFDRKNPYFWVFDPLVAKEKWVRQPPSYAEYIDEKHIGALVTKDRFPTPEGKILYVVTGLRVQESPNRRMGLFSSKNFVTKPKGGYSSARPIYDWDVGDVWKAIFDFKWDYNDAYDVMHRLGRNRQKMRIAPPTMSQAAIKDLQLGSKAWPQWFDRCVDRLDGVKTAAQFGVHACTPTRKSGETWKDCYYRECVDEAPEWIKGRSVIVANTMLKRHSNVSSNPFPEVIAERTSLMLGSWKNLAKVMWNGDPFSLKTDGMLPNMEPEFFRKGSGYWGGKPTW